MAPEVIGVGAAMIAVSLVLVMLYAIVRLEQRGGRGGRGAHA